MLVRFKSKNVITSKVLGENQRAWRREDQAQESRGIVGIEERSYVVLNSPEYLEVPVRT